MTIEQVKLIRELRGTLCRCGKEKGSMKAFCRQCYYTLSQAQRNSLYNLVGQGYEQAYASAVETLERRGRLRAA